MTTLAEFMEANQPCTAAEIAKALGISTQSVYERFKRKQMHIVAYADGKRGHPQALYMLGHGYNMPRPKAKTQAERGKLYWQRNKALLQARRSKTRASLGVWGGLL